MCMLRWACALGLCVCVLRWCVIYVLRCALGWYEGMYSLRVGYLVVFASYVKMARGEH